MTGRRIETLDRAGEYIGIELGVLRSAIEAGQLQTFELREETMVVLDEVEAWYEGGLHVPDPNGFAGDLIIHTRTLDLGEGQVCDNIVLSSSDFAGSVDFEPEHARALAEALIRLADERGVSSTDTPAEPSDGKMPA